MDVQPRENSSAPSPRSRQSTDSTEIRPVSADVVELLDGIHRRLDGLPDFMQSLGSHPQFLVAFKELQQFLFGFGGPVPINIRYYIAIMSASQYHCDKLVRYFEDQFLRCRGDTRWLEGLSHVPFRVQKLSEMLKVLAHQPWLLSPSHVKVLTVDPPDSWSLAELFHVVLVMVNTLLLSSLMMGMSNERGRSFSCPESTCLNPSVAPSRKYNSDPLFRYKDFSSRLERRHSILHWETFNWKSDGYALFQHYYGGSESVLDNLLSVAENSSLVGVEELPMIEDLNHIRWLIWTYIHIINGLYHDDYPYEQVNKVLLRPVKAFVKKVSCFPYEVNSDDRSGLPSQYQDTGLVHLCVLALASRMQVQLVYFCHALTNCLNSS